MAQPFTIDTTGWPKYQSHKIVSARKILELDRRSGSVILKFFGDFENVEIPNSLFFKHKPTADWYMVVYPDGYVSFSPPGPFQDGYTEVVEEAE